MKFTPENITHLEPNQVFVFGSNTSGRHGKGAAKLAMKWGARYGKGEGLYGQTYALPTLDDRFKQLLLGNISVHIRRFLKCAKEHPDLEFLVTKVGCGLAHFKVKEIAIQFFQFDDFRPLPENIVLPIEFFKYHDHFRL